MLLLCLKPYINYFLNSLTNSLTLLTKYFQKETESSKIKNETLKDFFENITYNKLRNWTDLRSGFGRHIYETIIKTIMCDDSHNLNDAIFNIKYKWGNSTKCPGQAINIETEVMLSIGVIVVIIQQMNL